MAFKKGDIIVGNEPANGYFVTGPGIRCEVIEGEEHFDTISGHPAIRVKALTLAKDGNPADLLRSYVVDSSKFRLEHTTNEDKPEPSNLVKGDDCRSPSQIRVDRAQALMRAALAFRKAEAQGFTVAEVKAAADCLH